MNDLAVHIRGVSKHFGEGDAKFFALKEASMDAYCGSINMIIGPSGCGKTTLLSIIAGTLSIDSGLVQVFDSPLSQMKNDAVTKFRSQNIGFVFQQFNLIPTLTIQENACLPILIQGKAKAEAFVKAAKLLEFVGLGNRLEARPNQLSVGQQQRVAIARALIHEPRLLICDEPTASLDGDTGLKIMELLRQIGKAPDRCVIVVTHDNRIFKFADRMILMEDGKVKPSRVPHE